MKEKYNLKKLILCTVFIFLLVASVKLVSDTLRDKSSLRKNKEFFSQDEDFDVLLFGSSHMELFINPMELWKKFGITSYNFGSPEQGVPVTYWTMKNAVELHHPKVVVFDVTMVGKGEKLSSEEHVHYALDSFPLNRNKVDAVNDLLSDTNERLEMFFTLGNYHNRWKELTKDDFVDTEPFMKGSMSYGFWHTIKVSPFKQYDIVDDAEHIENVDTYSRDIQYIDKMIALCQEEDIKLLFVANPIIADADTQKKIRGIEAYVKDRGVDFIDFVHMDSIVDYTVDMYDDGHVNQSGMNKISEYLGSYIVDKFGLKSHKGELSYSKWDDDYNNYKQLKRETVWWMVDDLMTTLEMLHDQDLVSYVFIGKDCTIANKDSDAMDFDDARGSLSEDDLKIIQLIQNAGRSNIVNATEAGKKSSELMPCEKLDGNYKINDYLAVLGDNNIQELSEAEALETINSVHDSAKFTSSDIGIIIQDRDSKETLIVRKFTDDINSHEDFYSSVENVYFK